MSWVASLLLPLIEWLIEKELIPWVKKDIGDFKKSEENQKSSDQSVQPLKDAKTGEEVDHASDSALNGF